MTRVRRRSTATGGRNATTRHISPVGALSVGMPSLTAPKGWQWSALTSLARLESGHTPSRRHPEYWGGTIPWISIQDAKANSGGRIVDTEEKTNPEGIENSSARVLPANTVCLSRTASVGYVVVMGKPMATSQDFVNWVCSADLDPDFLKYLLISEGNDLLRFASGAVHQTIYFPEVKAFHICHPSIDEQREIVNTLDRAISGIAAAKLSAERNRENAQIVFNSHLQSVLHSKKWKWKTLGDLCDRVEYGSSAKSKKEGKVAVLRMGNIQGGQLDWANLVYTSDKAEIKKYLLKHNDVLFNRTNSPELVGKTATYKSEKPAIFAGYLIRVCRKEDLLDADYLRYFLNSEIALDYGKTVAISSVNQANINGSKLKSYPIPTTSLAEQRTIVEQLDSLFAETQRLEGLYARKLVALDELQGALLHKAFSGELKKDTSKPTVLPFPAKAIGLSTTDVHAGLLAIACDVHERKGKLATFGHVKAEKFAHMVESYIGLDLGRTPVKDAAGPNDYPHLKKVEHRARLAGFFDFKRVDGSGYQVKKLPQFDALISKTRTAVESYAKNIDTLLDLMVPMNTQQAEIFSTVYAAWNNLLLDNGSATDDEIVNEAREDWHPDKLTIPREKFVAAIQWLKAKNMSPLGRGKRVVAKPRK